MKNLVLSICTLLFFLTSCQKEESFQESGGGNGGNGGVGGVPQTGTLLTRTVAVDGSDSTATTFNYDGSKRITFIKAGEYSMFNDNIDLRFIRSSGGSVQKVRFIQGTDSLEFSLNYNASSKQYISRIGVTEINGNTVKDSTAFVYDAGGKIVREDNYISNGPANIQIGKTEYTYDGNGNVKKVRVYSIGATAQLMPISELNFEYDSKVSPLKLGVEGIISGFFFYSSPNNITKLNIVDIEDPLGNDSMTITYTYNSENKPLKANVTLQSTGDVLETRYYY